MRDSPQKPGQRPRPELPPCEQAQADGVPCFELGRECETCERAYPEWREQVKRRASRQADGARD